MSGWAINDISNVLLQLNNKRLPFTNVIFKTNNGKIMPIAKGGTSYVYDVENHPELVIKVIGFSDKDADYDSFGKIMLSQKELSKNTNCVKIYEFYDLYIAFDECDNIEYVKTFSKQEHFDNTDRYQFILMEKLSPIICHGEYGLSNMTYDKITPKALEMGNEEEVLKLAGNIGLALRIAHSNKILHRDIKPENIFYSKKDNLYKLGDFGSAAITSDGFAKTRVFTKGYYAPEVISSKENDRYNRTADIYSFGMVLFYLLNDFELPENQYSKNFVLPRPKKLKSKKLYDILLRACDPDPFNRYQSMDDMLDDLDKVDRKFSLFNFNPWNAPDQATLSKQAKASLIKSFLLIALGAFEWRITSNLKDNDFEDFFTSIILVAIPCVIKGIEYFYKLSTKSKNLFYFSNILIIGTGIFSIIDEGFSAPKFIFLVLLVFFSGGTTGYIGFGLLFSIFGELFYSNYYISILNADFLAVLTVLLSLTYWAYFEIAENYRYIQENQNAVIIFNNFWKISIFFYLGIAFLPVLLPFFTNQTFSSVIKFLNQIDLTSMGLGGAEFCILVVVKNAFQRYLFKKTKND